MSVYTPLSLDEVRTFAAPYGLEVLELNPIQGGIQNTNYFLVDVNRKQYVLTVFEELDAQGAGELIPVLEQLGTHDVPVAVPLKHSGKRFTLLRVNLHKLHHVLWVTIPCKLQ